MEKNKKIIQIIVIIVFTIILIVLFQFSGFFRKEKTEIKTIYVPLHETIGTKKILEENIPPMVLKGLIFEFSNAEIIDWQSFNNYFIDLDDTVLNIYQDEDPSIYIANFIKDKHFFRAQFAKNGGLILYEEIIKYDELPLDVKNSYEAFYTINMIKGEIRKVNIQPDISYRIKINANNKDYILIYNQNGELLHEKRKLTI